MGVTVHRPRPTLSLLRPFLRTLTGTMVAWPIKKKEAEKKPDTKGAQLPIWRRLSKKQVLLGLLILQLLLSLIAVVVWYCIYQLELLPAGVHASFHTLATTLLISQKMGGGGEVEVV